MSETQDALLNKELKLEDVMRALAELPHEVRAHVALKVAAELLEYAAFELAPHHRPEDVAHLIRIAAQLNRSPLNTQDTKTFENAVPSMRGR